MEQLISEYIKRMHTALELPAMKEVPKLAAAMQLAWKNKKTIYLCGNGGSAGNANHLANDFLYGAGVKNGIGLRIDSLSANPAVITCLANDIGYENIYSEQLRVKIQSVSTRVNNARNDDPSLVEYAVIDESQPLSLF